MPKEYSWFYSTTSTYNWYPFCRIVLYFYINFQIELQKKRLLVQQMYHSSVLEIDNNDDQTFKIEPLEVLKFSSKIADTTMYKYTGSVVTLLEKGELILWNGERSVRLLHKPVLESPAYRITLFLI